MLKFICQEADDKIARAIGVALANAPKKLTQEFINNWKSQTLKLLRKPSTLQRIQSIMVKHYAHYRKTFGLNVKDVAAPTLYVNKHEFVDELRAMERKAFDQGYVFVGYPIVYRPDER
jgi:hypothetical protein